MCCPRSAGSTSLTTAPSSPPSSFYSLLCGSPQRRLKLLSSGPALAGARLGEVGGIPRDSARSRSSAKEKSGASKQAQRVGPHRCSWDAAVLARAGCFRICSGGRNPSTPSERKLPKALLTAPPKLPGMARARAPPAGDPLPHWKGGLGPGPRPALAPQVGLAWREIASLSKP